MNKQLAVSRRLLLLVPILGVIAFLVERHMYRIDMPSQTKDFPMGMPTLITYGFFIVCAALVYAITAIRHQALRWVIIILTGLLQLVNLVLGLSLPIFSVFVLTGIPTDGPGSAAGAAWIVIIAVTAVCSLVSYILALVGVHKRGANV